MKRIFVVFFLLVGFSSCYFMRSSNGGGQATPVATRKIDPTDIALAEGYKIEVVATGLSFPTAVTFNDRGELYYIEAGYSYGEIWKEPALVKITQAGEKAVIAKGSVNGPWTGVRFHEGNFFVAEGGERDGGRILKITPDGTITALVQGLPSMGDHHTNGPVIKDGYIYFGQGTATNSAVVGKDNADFGWLTRQQQFHDIPCADVIVSGNNYSSENPLTEDPSDKAVTGPFVPFNTSVMKDQVIKGSVPCTGSIMRIPLTGGKAELVAWGLRNPFGLTLSMDGELYVTENGFDERGSRPVWGAGDVLWKIESGKWYGWPDYSAGKPVTSDDEFIAPGRAVAKPVFLKAPGVVPKPVAILGVHASANGLDFSKNDKFGYKGEAFIAEFGDMAPKAGKVMSPVGFRVIRVDVKNGSVHDFAANKGKKNGPSTWLEGGGFERPVSVTFDPDGTSLYVVDFGILLVSAKGTMPVDNTGVIWRITKK